ncbi:hypothetical protein [Streptacidiphilus cavernicola]|uniref:Uncharacterized protein n=1 Tax=Streptacidiphilus cavernicola TaxID=3342716 RepID=A0ABV6VYC4_9ACTN
MSDPGPVQLDPQFTDCEEPEYAVGETVYVPDLPQHLRMAEVSAIDRAAFTGDVRYRLRLLDGTGRHRTYRQLYPID